MRLQELRRYTGIEPLLSAEEAKDELCDSLADAMAAATLREHSRAGTSQASAPEFRVLPPRRRLRRAVVWLLPRWRDRPSARLLFPSRRERRSGLSMFPK